jgi:hypothetical protein
VRRGVAGEVKTIYQIIVQGSPCMRDMPDSGWLHCMISTWADTENKLHLAYAYEDRAFKNQETDHKGSLLKGVVVGSELCRGPDATKREFSRRRRELG